jgi:hypothetical protein
MYRFHQGLYFFRIFGAGNQGVLKTHGSVMAWKNPAEDPQPMGSPEFQLSRAFLPNAAQSTSAKSGSLMGPAPGTVVYSTPKMSLTVLVSPLDPAF